MLRFTRERFYAVLIPQRCAACGENIAPVRNGNACDQCWESTKIFDGSDRLCERCGIPVPGISKGGAVSCSQCVDHRYDKARAVGVYVTALSAAVVGLKTTPSLSERAAALLFAAFRRSQFEDADLIVPVPLSKQRKLERSFNQSEVIANTLGALTRIKTDRHSLARLRHSPMHRAGMDQKARDLSVKNAFEVLRPKLIEGKRVLLVDDVLTTGATASYCAKALKRAGAVKVNVLTLARAVTHDL